MTVPKGETIDDTLVVAGESATIDGTVNGDLIALAREVHIRGRVKGDVFSLARDIEIDGAVDGSVISAGQNIDMRGAIARNLYAAGANIGIAKESSILGNASLFLGNLNIEGALGKDLLAFARWDGQVRLRESARIGGNLSVRTDNAQDVRIDSGAVIGGKRNILVPPPAQTPNRYATASFYIWQAIWLAAAFITGLLVFWLAPGLVRVSLDTTRTLLTAGGIGFLAVIAGPIAALLAAVTLVGLPLAFVALAILAVAIYLERCRCRIPWPCVA